MTIFVGDDWAEAHHDVHRMNEAGAKLAAKRLPKGLDGLAALLSMIAEHAADPCEVVVGIETAGMWVQTLIAGGFQVYANNPLSVSRYRDRHNVAGAKSDPGDALSVLLKAPHPNWRPPCRSPRFEQPSNEVVASAASTREQPRSNNRCVPRTSPPKRSPAPCAPPFG